MPDKPSDQVRPGIVMQRRLRDKLDEYAETRSEKTRENHSRSEVARMCIEVGLEANQIMDNKYGDDLSVQGRVGIARQAILDHERDHVDDTQFLIDALAAAEGIDTGELEQAVLRLQLDE